MTYRAYSGLGAREQAAGTFEGMTPWARELKGLQQECDHLGSDWLAVGIAFDSLQTAAFHFTRRPYFYHQLEAEYPPQRKGDGRLKDAAEANKSFASLRSYERRLRELQTRCRPYGRDFNALDIARQGLGTAAYHFTGDPHFYGAKGDSSTAG